MDTMLANVFHGPNDIRLKSVHRLSLQDIREGYDLFGSRSPGVLKILITP